MRGIFFSHSFVSVKIKNAMPYCLINPFLYREIVYVMYIRLLRDICRKIMER